MNFFKVISFAAPIIMEDTPPTVASSVSTITTTAGTLLQAVLGWLTNCTTWILSDPLALIGFVVAFVMLAIHVLHSLVKFSW